MSGVSGEGICPNCGSDRMQTYSDWKPYDGVSGECLDCGFQYWTQASYMTLDEVNELRADYEMEKLTELPEQDKGLI
jgi:hypothetical protein